MAQGFIADTVGLLQNTDWTNHEKRAVAIKLAEAKMVQRGEEAKEGAIRAAIEISVGALKQGGTALAELGDEFDDDRDLVELPREELDLARGEA